MKKTCKKLFIMTMTAMAAGGLLPAGQRGGTGAAAGPCGRGDE
jgi:hypothetical protein